MEPVGPGAAGVPWLFAGVPAEVPAAGAGAAELEGGLAPAGVPWLVAAGVFALRGGCAGRGAAGVPWLDWCPGSSPLGYLRWVHHDFLCWHFLPKSHLHFTTKTYRNSRNS